jgi:hypothetical protein
MRQDLTEQEKDAGKKAMQELIISYSKKEAQLMIPLFQFQIAKEYISILEAEIESLKKVNQ